MKTPRDGWDPEEQKALGEVAEALEAVRNRHRTDPPIELLQAARAEVLPEELQERVARRLAEHAWSRTLVEGTSYEESVFDREHEARLLARIQHEAAADTRRRRWRWPFHPGLALAAAGLTLVAGLAIWRSLRPEETGPPASDVATAPAPAPAFHLPLQAPRVRLSAAVLTWRGPDEKNHLLADLKPGMDAFRSGDYRTANAELSKIATTYPDAFDVRYYQGVSRLFVDDDAGAIEALTAARRTADASFAADATWYLAVAYERAGQTAKARQELSSLCKDAAAHAAEACAALDQMK